MMHTLIRLLVLFAILTVPMVANRMISQFRGDAPSSSSVPARTDPVKRS